jgi:23S rRNA pseudouridine955/2504/2580 synthase/23S rRNA pseudouridine1911/1915/1917 synthase
MEIPFRKRDQVAQAFYAKQEMMEQVHKKVHLKDLIIFGNEDFIILNKPSGVLSIPDRFDHELLSLKKLLEDQYGKIYVVHRLDRDTSGIILFARNEASHQYFSHVFEHREVEKVYTGIVHGKPAMAKGTISQPIAENPARHGKMMVHAKGKPSVTHYKVIEDLPHFSVVEFNIETGRTHQIRVHCQHIGHPIIGDELYGSADPILLSSFKKKFKLAKTELEERPILSRLALHASRLTFSDQQGKELVFEAPLAKDMRAFIQQFRKLK